MTYRSILGDLEKAYAFFLEKLVNVELVKQQTLLEKIRENIKKQINDAFDIAKEITGQITKSVSSVSKSIAESIVLGKERNSNSWFKQLKQQILVNIIAKTIEKLL